MTVAPEPKTQEKLKIRTSYTQHTNTHHSQIHKERETCCWKCPAARRALKHCKI